jgi:hypothetical protein
MDLQEQISRIVAGIYFAAVKLDGSILLCYCTRIITGNRIQAYVVNGCYTASFRDDTQTPPRGRQPSRIVYVFPEGTRATDDNREALIAQVRAHLENIPAGSAVPDSTVPD